MMMQQCMPCPTLAKPISVKVPLPPALVEVATPQSNDDWFSAKKRKRTVACGQCDACCRDDCGTCLNCLDKPKFGGSGIRKQSCLERKCRQPMAAPTPGSGLRSGPIVVASSTPAVQLATTLLGAPPDTAPAAKARSSMAPQEFEQFWSAVQCCMLLQGGPAAADAHAAMLEQMHEARSAAKASAQRARTNRCGGCAGCLRGDCGACKNCRDKPKFGGKGIKKQACVRRACNNPLPDVHEDDEDFDDDECEPLAKTARVLANGPDGFLSAAPSPSSSASQHKGSVPIFELGADAKMRSKVSNGSCGMLQDTRRRLQELRAANGAITFENGAFEDIVRPSSSMSTGYSTADEYEVDAEEPDDDSNGSEQNSATDDADEGEGVEGTSGEASGEALLVALARSGSREGSSQGSRAGSP